MQSAHIFLRAFSWLELDALCLDQRTILLSFRVASHLWLAPLNGITTRDSRYPCSTLPTSVQALVTRHDTIRATSRAAAGATLRASVVCGTSRHLHSRAIPNALPLDTGRTQMSPCATICMRTWTEVARAQSSGTVHVWWPCNALHAVRRCLQGLLSRRGLPLATFSPPLQLLTTGGSA